MRDDAADDLAAFGAPAEMVNAATKADDSFEVFEENKRPVVMFLKLQTQWAITNGAFVGLNYQSVEFLFKIHAVDAADAADLMDDLQAMEAAALQILNKSKD